MTFRWDRASQARAKAVARGRDQPVNTWYRRRKQARERAAAGQAAAMRHAALDRLAWQVAQLRADLQKAARFMGEDAAIIDELAGVSFWAAL
jgi:hypothetical protein